MLKFIPSLLAVLFANQPVRGSSFYTTTGEICPPPPRRRRKFKGWQRQLREKGRRR